MSPLLAIQVYLCTGCWYAYDARYLCVRMRFVHTNGILLHMLILASWIFTGPNAPLFPQPLGGFSLRTSLSNNVLDLTIWTRFVSDHKHNFALSNHTNRHSWYVMSTDYCFNIHSHPRIISVPGFTFWTVYRICRRGFPLHKILNNSTYQWALLYGKYGF